MYCQLFWYCGRYWALCLLPGDEKLFFIWLPHFSYSYIVYCGSWNRGSEVSFGDFFVSRIFFWRTSLKSKMVVGLLASHTEGRSFCKLFLIPSLPMAKFTCPSSIIDSMAKDRKSFVLTI